MRASRSVTLLVLGILIVPSLPAASAGHVQTSPTGQEVAFDHKTGNEWWVETVLSGADAGSVEAVEAKDEGGPWVELTKRSWGAWAASFHIEPGHEVRFQATFEDGSQVTSCWFTHPDGVESCREDPTPPPGGTEATFDHKTGNEWWVQVDVGGAEPSRVQAMDTGGDWHELTLRHWGDWAGSFHIEPGHEVRFRAMVDATWQTSCWFTHPAGEERCRDEDPPPLDEPGELDAAFAPKAGNAWWIETYAIANSTITSVEARADGGDWHELTLRDWGTWAASFHAPAGSEVTFRATNETGAVGTSEAFLWPEAVPAADPDGEWPQEGSYVHYEESGGGPTSSFAYERDSTFVYHDGRWIVRCQGYSQTPGGRNDTFAFTERAPSFGPLDVETGDRLNVSFGTCHGGSYDVIVQGKETEQVHHEGDGITVDTWFANRTADCRCLAWEMEWETETGLVTDAWRGGRTADRDDLQDTDAPIR